jgi:phenylalanyl-tRNA synthetase beta chain
MKISYNWLKWYVPELVETEKLSDIFTYHLCEVESVVKIDSGSEAGTTSGDVVFDLNILPNRAHDLLSHQGIAKELAGQLGISYKDPLSMYKVPVVKPSNLRIDIQSTNCRRYMGRVVRNVKIGPSPEWMAKHLESIGQRSINNIVDATNLVMFDCGQPVHAFDAEKITDLRLEIREAKEGEELPLLGSDKIVAKLKDTDLVITSGDKTLALAGIKGGLESGVSENTKDIILEVANFDPVSVRKTARRLGILSDSAKRFENDLSPELAPNAMQELSSLILEMCPEAEFEEIVGIYSSPQTEKKVSFTTDAINKKLGSTITGGEVEMVLKNYSFIYAKSGDLFEITVPSLRLDITNETDMVEEIGRIIGYDKVAPAIPKINFVPDINETFVRAMVAREHFLSSGYSEVMTYVFKKKGSVEVARGAKGKEFLRTNLSDGLKESYELNKTNAALLELNEVKIFEIGTVFPEKDKEEIHVAWADKKGVQEMTLEEGTKDVKDFSIIPADHDIKSKTFQVWSLYPFIMRDIALWVPQGVESEKVLHIIKENTGEILVKGPTLFDQFSKDGKTSYAFRMVFQATDRTLTDEEIAPIMTAITKALVDNGWEVR